MRVRKVESWVVYRTAVKGQPTGVNAVCEAGEWEAMQAAQPGVLTLIQSGIASEGEAERLARGTSGDPVPRNGSRPVDPPPVQ
ncbi:MAG: hypothetical protein JWO38_3783 [Gemmataceae bacterium]|nr:hypothetical protein [Gemmataceae bacterium]